ncbi:MAG: hypothetical protein WED04_09625 [Promethearchaeati archaeon SRVP18_Atabeyarchaeia-1]
MESAVKPLLEAAVAEQWKDVLSILYLNGSVIALSEDLQMFCLVSASGPYQDIDRSMDILKGKSEVELVPVFKEFFSMLLPRIMVILRKEEVALANKEEKQQMLAMMLMAEFQGEQRTYQRDISRIIVQGASSLSGSIAVGVAKTLLEMRDRHIHSALDEEDYELMIEGLRRLNIIESALQVSLCPECANYQFTVSRYPSLVEVCPRCGSEWVTLTLYSLQPPYSLTKADNSDLPLFISAYLKHKIGIAAPTEMVKILPKAVIKTNEDKTIEVDVYLPDYDAGIECKVYEDAFAPMTQSRLGTIVGHLIPQIKRYTSIGIKTVIVVTNLDEGSLGKLKSGLQDRLANEDPKPTVEVLPGEINTLLNWLNQRSSAIAKQIQDSLNKALTDSIQGKHPLDEK